MTAPTATQPWGPSTSHPPCRKQGPPRKRPPSSRTPSRARRGPPRHPLPPRPTTGRTHHARGGEQQRRRHNIATSRTGTATWKRIRAQALKQAIDNNITHCASCGVGLDYEYTRRPNSAEVDHVIPYSKGGTDTLGNTTVICRWCNQRKGNGRNLAVPQPKTIEPGTSIEW